MFKEKLVIKIIIEKTSAYFNVGCVNDKKRAAIFFSFLKTRSNVFFFKLTKKPPSFESSVNILLDEQLANYDCYVLTIVFFITHLSMITIIKKSCRLEQHLL